MSLMGIAKHQTAPPRKAKERPATKGRAHRAKSRS
jgi:hypothetical protein